MLVATTQFMPVFKQVDLNLQMMTHLIDKAYHKGAKVVVLPELATTGYSFLSKREALEFSENLGDPKKRSVFDSMLQLSKSLDMVIVWGFVESDDSEKCYNSQCMVTPEGNYYVYRKMNRWGNDFIWAFDGEDSPMVIKWRGKRMGMLICRDIRNKADKEDYLYAKGDADMVLFSSNFGDGGFPAVAWMDFVKDTGIPLVVSNRYGQETCNNFGEGGICIIHANLHVECTGLEWDSPSIVYSDL